MAFEQLGTGRQKVLYNSANTTNKLQAQLVLNGAKVTAASATITIYRRGSSTALVSGAAMTMSGSIATYAVSTTTTASWPIETGYRAEVTFTYSSATYVRVYIFDVVRFLLDLGIGVDQLVSLDSVVASMDHNGDDDFSPLIIASRSVIQAILEAKAVKEKQLVENMILDHSALATAGCFYILAQIWLNKSSETKYANYMSRFDALMDAVLNGLRFDLGQDGDEDAEPQGVTLTRFEL